MNEDLIVNSVDIVHLINYTFLGILPPENYLKAADLGCSGYSSPADVVLLMTRVFNSHSFPC